MGVHAHVAKQRRRNSPHNARKELNPKTGKTVVSPLNAKKGWLKSWFVEMK
jgi:hypothetical protein